MRKCFTPRNIAAMGFSLAAGLVLISGYLQVTLDLTPCALCITQRLLLTAITTTFLLCVVHRPGQLFKRIYGGTVMLFSMLGFLVAFRQVYLESLPSELAPACGPGLGYLFQHFDFLNAFKILLTGTGDCAEITWQFMSLSLAGWMMLFFTLLFIIGGLLVGPAKPLANTTASSLS